MKRKNKKYYTPEANEWVPHLSKARWKCCDCGLVHNVEFKINTLEVRMTRNYKETIKARKGKEL